MPSPIAVIDIGSNSTRLLVAEVADGRVQELERRSEVTRLAEGVDASGRLAEPAIERVLGVLADYKELIDRHGAGQVVAVATSAVRDSDNGDEFRATLRERFGFDARILTGDEEAQLTFLGATAARSGTATALVIDIGGGSTELVIGRPGVAPDFHHSTQAGSVRQTERHLHDDPPTAEQVDDLRREVRAIFDAAVPRELRARVEVGVAVAGTATQLGSVEQELEPYDPTRVDGFRLDRASVERLLGRLSALPLAERREIRGLHPDRAPTIVAGAAIMLEAIAAFGLDSVEIAVADILHGAALTSREHPYR